MKRHSTILFLSTLCLSTSHAIPAWVKSNPEKLNGSTYTVNCYGEGPALDIARNQAKDSCLSSASKQARNQFKVKTLTVETETSVGLHQEVETDSQVTGLVCNPLNEYVQESDSQFKVWIQCRFDLALIKFRPSLDGNNVTPTTSDDSVKNRKELSSVKSKRVSAGRNITSSERGTLTISSVPKCTSIIIEGKRPRVESCIENPLSIVVFEGDRKIIVRADGYQPKTVILSDSLKPNETVQIILEENQK